MILDLLIVLFLMLSYIRTHYPNSGIAKVDNSESLSYGWMMLLLYFCGATIIWFAWTYMYDLMLTTTINPAIVAGTMSVQAVNAGKWNVNVVKFGVPLILILGFIYGVNRAIYAKGRIQ